MQVYFDILYMDTKASAFGETYIVPSHHSTTAGDPTPLLSHDCASFPEMENVIDTMIADLKKLKLKSKRHFEKLHQKKLAERA